MNISYFWLKMAGNGLFLLEMARRRKDLNFLGLEINRKVSCSSIFFFSLFTILSLCFNFWLLLINFIAGKTLPGFCSSIWHSEWVWFLHSLQFSVSKILITLQVFRSLPNCFASASLADGFPFIYSILFLARWFCIFISTDWKSCDFCS